MHPGKTKPPARTNPAPGAAPADRTICDFIAAKCSDPRAQMALIRQNLTPILDDNGANRMGAILLGTQ